MYKNLPVRDATSLVVGCSPHISKLLVDINSDSSLELMGDIIWTGKDTERSSLAITESCQGSHKQVHFG